LYEKRKKEVESPIYLSQMTWFERYGPGFLEMPPSEKERYDCPQCAANVTVNVEEISIKEEIESD
jgi:hypothetical protein